MSARVSSGIGQLGIDYLIIGKIGVPLRYDTFQYWLLPNAVLKHRLRIRFFPEMKVDFKKQNVRTFKIFYESMGLPEANFLRPLAKLCVQDAGHMPKKITVKANLLPQSVSYLLRNSSTIIFSVIKY